MQVQEVVSSLSVYVESVSEASESGEIRLNGREQSAVQLVDADDARIVRAPEVPWPESTQVPHSNKAVGVAARAAWSGSVHAGAE